MKKLYDEFGIATKFGQEIDRELSDKIVPVIKEYLCYLA